MTAVVLDPGGPADRCHLKKGMNPGIILDDPDNKPGYSTTSGFGIPGGTFSITDLFTMRIPFRCREGLRIRIDKQQNN